MGYLAYGRLDELLGAPDEQVTKDRLYRTLDQLLAAKDGIEQDVEGRGWGHYSDLKFDPGAVRPDQQLLRGPG